MRTFAAVALLFALVACVPQVAEESQPSGQLLAKVWDVPLLQSPAAVIGASTKIVKWEPVSACQPQKTIPDVMELDIFAGLAIKCSSPNQITVYLAEPGRVNARYVSEK